MNRRIESRLLLELPGRYATAGCEAPVYFSDLSANGCRLATAELGAGQALEVYLGPVGPPRATVRWANNGEVGIQFEVALDAEIVAYFAGFCVNAA